MIAAMFAAGACAKKPVPRAGAAAPISAPPSTPPSAPASAAPRAPASAPSGTAPVSSVPAAPESGGQWVKPGLSKAEYRADLESCFRYAQAQIAHDERIETDTGAAFDAAPSGLGVTRLRSGMTAFERKNRRTTLYHECMRAKGYVER